MTKKAIRLNALDNVSVVLEDGAAGDRFTVSGPMPLEVVIHEAIRFGHKIALKEINPGEKIIKYGHPIGMAVKEIRAGDHVHVHNVAGLRAGAKGEKGD